MDILAKEDLGLDPSSCSGLMTVASMDNSAISTLAYDDFSVTSVATAGVRNNGGRIGDPASWHEKSENTFEDTTSSDTKKKNPIQNLTKNILGKIFQVKLFQIKINYQSELLISLYIDADLSKEALASALVSCTEAKVAAMQELLIASRYSCGIATGTGTDGAIIISNAESKTHLTNAGKHSKLGELIGRTVISSIKEALKLQQGITPQIQHDIIHRMDRFGVTEDALWDCYKETYRNLIRAEFTDILDRIRTDDTLVTYTSLYAHLLDQLSWGLLSFAECRIAANELLKLAVLHPDAECGTENIIQNYILAIADRIHRESLKKK
ncbi:MAG: adenosylcobinamide amidohydrolase [Anaerobutyricum soehngenii]